MQREYEQNEKKQEKSFKKIKKAFVKIGISAAALGLFASFSFPIGPIFSALSGILGEGIAMNVAFFSQLGCIGASLGGIIVNGIKAKKAKKEIDSLKENNNDIVNKMVHQNEEIKEKLNELEKGNSLMNNEKEKTKITDSKIDNINYKELISVYEKQTLENLRELSTDDIEDDKDDINEYKSILNEVSLIKNNYISDKEKYDKIHELYIKTVNLIEKANRSEKTK